MINGNNNFLCLECQDYCMFYINLFDYHCKFCMKNGSKYVLNLIHIVDSGMKSIHLLIFLNKSCINHDNINFQNSILENQCKINTNFIQILNKNYMNHGNILLDRYRKTSSNNNYYQLEKLGLYKFYINLIQVQNRFHN